MIIKTETEQRNIFITSIEYEMLTNLAFDEDQPIGNFIIKLAREHLTRKAIQKKETNEPS